MDFTTKEWLEDRLDTIEDKLDALVQLLSDDQDNETNSEEDVEQTDSELDVEV